MYIDVSFPQPSSAPQLSIFVIQHSFKLWFKGIYSSRYIILSSPTLGGTSFVLKLPLYLAWEGLDNIPPQFRVAENTRRTPLAARHRRVESLLLNRELVFKQLEDALDVFSYFETAA